MGDLPKGYDHKYIYSQIGYNLKLTDMQAGIGVAQLTKLPEFIKIRRQNFTTYYKFFSAYEKYFILTEAEPGNDPDWFGFMLMVKPNAPFTKDEIVAYLEAHQIATRGLFAGNITKHPAYVYRKDIRISGKLIQADQVMQNGFLDRGLSGNYFRNDRLCNRYH